MKTSIFLLLFLCLTFMAHANKDSLKQIKPPKNVIYPTIGVGVPIVLYGAVSLNYERLLSGSLLGTSNNLYARLTYGAWGAYGSGGTYYSLSTAVVFGRKSLHFETNVGVGRIYDQTAHKGDSRHPVVNETRKKDHTFTLPIGSIGLRVQRPNGHLMLKLGASFPEGFYLGFGFRF